METISKRIFSCFLIRMTVILSSVIFSLPVLPQIPLSQKLNNVLISKDRDKMIKLYKEIKPEDLTNLPDSSLLDYHYLAAGINLYEENSEIALSHLLSAKELLEQSIGLKDLRYVEIMRQLGDLYVDLGDYDKALAIFQEGIIKSMDKRSSIPEEFSNLIMGVNECYENKGQLNESVSNYLDAWSFWPKSTQPFSTLNYFPLWRLQYLFSQYGKYVDALEVNDKIIFFITETVGDNHPAMVDALYFRGGFLNSLERFEEASSVYNTALSILNLQDSIDSEEYKRVIGNYLNAIINTDKRYLADTLLNEIKSYSLKYKDDEFYHNALYTAADRFNGNGDFTKSISLLDELLTINLNKKQQEFIEYSRKKVIFNKESTESISDLKMQLEQLPEHSVNWFETAIKLSNGYYLLKKEKENLTVLNNLYENGLKFPEIGTNYTLWACTNLYSYYVSKENFEIALKYATDHWNVINMNLDKTNEQNIFNSLNNLIVVKIQLKDMSGIDDLINKEFQLISSLFGENSIEYAAYLHNKARVQQLKGKYKEAKENYLLSIMIQKEKASSIFDKTWDYLVELEKEIENQELSF